MSVHETNMHLNVNAFRGQLEGLRRNLPSDPAGLGTVIDTFSKYEDYILKSRQANHSRFTEYGSNYIALVGAMIALAVGLSGYFGNVNQKAKDNADLILRVIQTTDADHLHDHLESFRNAGLITLTDLDIEKLTMAWRDGTMRSGSPVAGQAK